MVPYDALRALEKQGIIGKAHTTMLSASGSMANLSTMQRLGREMGEYLRKEGVDAVLLTAT
jgi:glycine reductase